MTLKVEVSVGEFLDKMTILEIKTERMQDPQKLENVKRELALLHGTWAASPLSESDVEEEVGALKKVNESLWDIEDRIRHSEAAQTFDKDFIELARSVYRLNDERAAIKHRLNVRLKSRIVEEKSYPDYLPPGAGDAG
jgi:septation ring formation regulator EzrA